MTPSQVPILPQVPFGSQTDYNPLHTIFQNQETKQKYFQIKRKIKLSCNLSSSTNFLKNCISANTIPKSFRINVKTNIQTSPQFQKSWENSKIKSSKILINLAINENKQKLIKINQDISVTKQELLNNLDLNAKATVNKLLEDFSEKLNASSKKSKLKKFRFLRASDQNDHPPNENNSNKSKNRPGKRYRVRKRQTIINQKKQQISTVFNFSSITVDKHMESLLNKGLNFNVKGKCPTESDILADLQRFQRRILWKEHFFDQNDSNYTPPLFHKEKTNLPSGPRTKPLMCFLNTVSSNIRDKSNWNKHLIDPTRTNISKDEEKALNQLILLQKQQRIVIKQCDKGGGISIMDFDKYVVECRKHLNSVQLQGHSPPLPYYKHASNKDIVTAKKEILQTLNHGLYKDYISKDEHAIMNPTNYNVGKFYQILKVHKNYEPGCLPPSRPIISGIGSITEKLSCFVDYHSKSLVKDIPTYIQDTPDFLRSLEAINTEGEIPETAILCTIDVSALYTNIRKDDAIPAMRESLNQRSTQMIQKVPTEFIIQILELVLKYNIFEFGNEKFQQLIGVAMGTVCAPTVACLVMHKIDQQFKDLAIRILNSEDPIMLLKRFIDDFFMVWKKSWQKLDEFLTAINNIHPTLKFTYEYTCPYPCDMPENISHDCFCHTSRSIAFLDTLVEIKGGKIVTDLYTKPTNRAGFLRKESNHPPHIFKNIPYSRLFSLLRICSKEGSFEKRTAEFREQLLSRNYLPEVINQAIERIQGISRNEALKKVEKKKNSDRIPLVITYHPAMPHISSILRNAWNVLVRDKHMKRVFSQPPMVAYKQPPTALRNLLVKTKLQVRDQRVIPGLRKCRKARCYTCPLLEESTVVTSSVDKNIKVFLSSPVTCESSNVIYCIFCNKQGCDKIMYIGETERQLKVRIREHISYVHNLNITTPTGFHFNLPNHSIQDMKVQVIEKCKETSTVYRKIREQRFINLFETFRKGLNKKM